MVRTLACHARGRGFEPLPGRQKRVCYEQTPYAGVAQQVEQLTCNQQVGGSIPSTSSKMKGHDQRSWLFILQIYLTESNPACIHIRRVTQFFYFWPKFYTNYSKLTIERGHNSEDNALCCLTISLFWPLLRKLSTAPSIIFLYFICFYCCING